MRSIKIQNRVYVPVSSRVVEFRKDHPNWSIETHIVHLDFEKGYVTVRAEVRTENGQLIATGLRSETRANFQDFIEKAETGAVGRALAFAGYGTEGLIEGRVVDAPVEENQYRPGPGGFPRQRPEQRGG